MSPANLLSFFLYTSVLNSGCFFVQFDKGIVIFSFPIMPCCFISWQISSVTLKKKKAFLVHSVKQVQFCSRFFFFNDSCTIFFLFHFSDHSPFQLLLLLYTFFPLSSCRPNPIHPGSASQNPPYALLSLSLTNICSEFLIVCRRT